MCPSEVRKRAAYRSSSVYSVFSGEICPVTGCRNDVALRLWLQDRGRWKIQKKEKQNGQHFVIQATLIIPPNEAFLHLNLATGCRFSRMTGDECVSPAWWRACSPEPRAAAHIPSVKAMDTALSQPSHQVLLISVRGNYSLL